MTNDDWLRDEQERIEIEHLLHARDRKVNVLSAALVLTVATGLWLVAMLIIWLVSR